MKGIGLIWIAIVLAVVAAGCLDDEIRITRGDMNESFNITFEQSQSGWRVLSNETDFEAYITADMIDPETGAVPDLKITLENDEKIRTGDLIIYPGEDFSGRECYYINSTDLVGKFDISLGTISRSGEFIFGTTKESFEGTMLIYPSELEPKKMKGEETEVFLIVSGKL